MTLKRTVNCNPHSHFILTVCMAWKGAVLMATELLLAGGDWKPCSEPFDMGGFGDTSEDGGLLGGPAA
jgi:hypothetical protein